MRSRPPATELPERTEILGGKCGGVGRSGEEEEAAPGSRPFAGAHGGLVPVPVWIRADRRATRVAVVWRRGEIWGGGDSLSGLEVGRSR